MTTELLSQKRPEKPMAYAVGLALLAGILMLALHDPIPVLGALMITCGVIAVMQFPIIALLALLFIEPFHDAIVFALLAHAHIGVGSLYYWKDVVILALFVRAIVRRYNLDRGITFPPSGDVVLIGYVLIFVVLAIASPPRTTLVSALSIHVEGPLLLLSIVWLRPSRKELQAAAIAIVAAASVMGAAAIIEHFGPKDSFQTWYGAPRGHLYIGATNTYRSASFLNDTLILGFYLAAGAPLAAAFSSLRSRLRPWAVVALVACAGGLFFTYTRSGYIGGGVGVLLVLLLTVKNPGIRLSLVGIIVVLAGAATYFYIHAGSETLVRSSSNASHTSALRRDLSLLYARPEGYGLGTTDRFASRPGVGRGAVGATESTYMAKALEGGVLGLVAYVLALFVTVMRLVRKYPAAVRARDRTGAAIVAGAIGTMTALILAGIFLGIQALVVEIILWATPGVALAWPLEPKAA